MDFAALFETHRRMMFTVAYRMLGSVSDAEDILQDAYVRWASADHDAVEAPAAFLRKVVTRLCLDQLKSIRRRREDYVGPWLPEPTIDGEPAEDVTLPLLVALERLSPLERAAFLLHDVFGESFDAVARILKREPATCRQLARRARENVRADRPRFPIDRQRGLEIAAAFFDASRHGEIVGLAAMLADDVSLHADGGGKRPAAPHVIRGKDDVEQAIAALGRMFRKNLSEILRYTFVNGLPGFVTLEADGLLQTTALLIEDGRIRAIYVMRNPDKLRHLGALLH